MIRNYFITTIRNLVRNKIFALINIFGFAIGLACVILFFLWVSDEVSYEDASGAVNLMNATLEKLAKDSETGKLDIDKYSSGISDQSRRRLDRIDALIEGLIQEAEDGEPVAISKILEEAGKQGLDKIQVERAINLMIRAGKLFEPQPGRVQKI